MAKCGWWDEDCQREAVVDQWDSMEELTGLCAQHFEEWIGPESSSALRAYFRSDDTPT